LALSHSSSCLQDYPKWTI